MRLLCGYTLRAVGGHRGACTIGLALVGGLIVTWALLGPRPGVVRMPALSLAPSADEGGETVVAKLIQTGTEDASGPALTEPLPKPRHFAMMLAPSPSAQSNDKEPSLEGLSDIPRDLIWNRKPDKEDKAEPKTFAAFSKAREVLPWDAVEPVPFASLSSAPAQEPVAAEATGAVSQPLALPENEEVETWVKAKVTEIKGADRERPLYHFELWLEPPADVKRRLVGVAYEFSTPAVMPQSQASSDQASGFRVSAGGLACADEITVTLRFDDGRSEKVALDGCKLFS